jgi:hypothetical protein
VPPFASRRKGGTVYGCGPLASGPLAPLLAQRWSARPQRRQCCEEKGGDQVGGQVDRHGGPGADQGDDRAGNVPVQGLVTEWLADNPGAQVQFHNWWNAPLTWAKVMEIDPVASHASWMENFPWTRLPGVASPDQQKPMVDFARLRMVGPAAVREQLGDGNYGGLYTRVNGEMESIWRVAGEETRSLLTRWS